MEIKEIVNKEEWERFLKEAREKTFLHSWQWGEFQRLMRGKVWRFGLYAAPQKRGELRPDESSGREETELKAVVLVVRVAAKRGTFLLVPHGPVFADSAFMSTAEGKSVSKFEILRVLLKKLKEIAKEENASFIRINPILERGAKNNAIFEQLGFRKAPTQMHPEASWKLGLAAPEEQLFSGMRKTTRYLLRQAMKNQDIAIKQSSSLADVAVFSKLHEQVSKRQTFVPFSREYLENEFEVFSKDNEVLLFFGTYKGEIAAAAFVVFWSGIGFYHHAVSLPKFSKLSIPYLLQWEAIKEAKRRGCIVYDFWGYVDPKTQPKHPWAGPTLFKQGFGGEPTLYVKTQDYPLSLKYWPIAFFEALRRIRRHL